MDYSDIKFNKHENKFQHNLMTDFGCIALWKSARPYLNDIRNLLHDKFEVLLETEIEWSAQHFHSNAQRLYEAPMYTGIKQNALISSHSNKIGDNKFILFIVRDAKPHYTYAQSVSGKIEMSNINIVNAKYEIRDWINADTGIKYGVHSTNNIHEFFFQVPLLLGVERFRRLLNSEKIIEPFIKKDLEGAEGWKNYHELFEILNLTTNYLVQRGFETLPYENLEMDIDFLTDNHQRLASALGAKQNKNQLYKGEILVNNREISLDLRYVGDKYYDVNWEKDMLLNKVIQGGVYTPREDDYFFSLLFHAKVQKQNVKEKYVCILEDLSESLSFIWYKTEYLQDNQIVGGILRGYYQSQAYVYENPIDKGVYRNKDVINLLPIVKTYRIKKSFKSTLKGLVIRGIPKNILPLIKKMIGK
jgi:hypothetical protein